MGAADEVGEITKKQVLNDLESYSEIGKMLPKSLCKANMVCRGCAFSKVVGIRLMDSLGNSSRQTNLLESINNDLEHHKRPVLGLKQ